MSYEVIRNLCDDMVDQDHRYLGEESYVPFFHERAMRPDTVIHAGKRDTILVPITVEDRKIFPTLKNRTFVKLWIAETGEVCEE